MHPDKPFAGYADRAVVHCEKEVASATLKADLEKQLAKCAMELNQAKTRKRLLQGQQATGAIPEHEF